MKKVLLALLMAVLLGSAQIHAAKPQSPLQVTIVPVQFDQLAEAIKPGEVVELKIIGKTFVDADELSIKVKLHGGMELISGETTWVGSLKKGQDKVLLLAVRVTKQVSGQGYGRIMARIAMPPTAGASFVAEAEYEFGSSTIRKPAELPAIKKDGKGREVREYRVN